MYHVELQEFEGPMDLLLFFVKRDEIDVYDIPIARISDEYLAYVRVLEEIDLDGVADFVYMAALLVNIKAQMLLPSGEGDGEGEEVDPRRELVERLMEYVRFKEAAQQLETQRKRRKAHFTRGDTSTVRNRVEENHEARIDQSVYDLVQVLGHMLDVSNEEDEEDSVHEVTPVEHTVEEQQRYVLEQIQRRDRLSFRSLIEEKTKGFVIATFLAILELTRQQYLRIELSEGPSDFCIREREGHPLQPDDPVLQPRAPSGDGAR